MNYKKIIPSRLLRNKILKWLSWVSDELMLKIQYKLKMGRVPNLKEPQRFTEKLQWYKINYRNPLMHKCVDKLAVREYVESKGLKDILVRLMGVYDNLEDVNWGGLPNQFVMKTTNGGGGLNVVVCSEKSELDIKNIISKMALKTGEKGTGGREWAYYGLLPKIIVEELLINEQEPVAGINDYKFFCYRGKPEYIVVDTDRYIGHKRNFYDVNWNKLDIISDCSPCDKEISKPDNLDYMIEVASKLSEDFPYVRVDLYSVNDRVYFGELTFYPWSGYVQFDPDEWDYKFGRNFELIEMKG